MTNTARPLAAAMLAATTIALVVNAGLQLLVDAVSIQSFGSGTPWWIVAELPARGRWVVAAALLWLISPIFEDSHAATSRTGIARTGHDAEATRAAIWSRVGTAVTLLPLVWAVASWLVVATRITLVGSWDIEGRGLLSSEYYQRIAIDWLPWLMAGVVMRWLAAHIHVRNAPAQSGILGAMPSTVSVKVFNAQGQLVGPFDVTRVERTDAEWMSQLTPEQFRVARAHGTERPFCGTLLDNKRHGVYSCVCCGLPLFSSLAKFDSGTGWPSFFEPVADENVATKRDTSYGMVRVEILCARCDAHLGHVFPDGPAPTHQRHCVNSESLQFTDVDQLASLADPALPAPAGPPAAP
jgi:methionine-R-sulfoxide reductase